MRLGRRRKRHEETVKRKERQRRKEEKNGKLRKESLKLRKGVRDPEGSEKKNGFNLGFHNGMSLFNNEIQ